MLGKLTGDSAKTAPFAACRSPRMTKHKSKSASKESATAIFASKIVFQHFHSILLEICM